MKTIVKTEANRCLQEAKARGWSWDNFHDNAHDEYLAVREQALSDQRNECAYTGLWIGEGTSRIVHIDHFRKKALYPELSFDWQNLFAAAKDPDYGSDCKDSNICGQRRQADGQYKTFLSPTDANLEQLFWYRQDGKIEPNPRLSNAATLQVKRTIEMYNLNAQELIRRRKGIIENVRSLQQLDDEEVRQCMATAGFSFVVELELRHREELA